MKPDDWIKILLGCITYLSGVIGFIAWAFWKYLKKELHDLKAKLNCPLDACPFKKTQRIKTTV
jgi:hypothetical protein